MDDVIFALRPIGPHRGMSTPLHQRVTSLRRRAKANASAPSYWLRRVVVAEIRRVHRAGGGGGGACNNAGVDMQLLYVRPHRAYARRVCGLLLQTEWRGLRVCLSVSMLNAVNDV